MVSSIAERSSDRRDIGTLGRLAHHAVMPTAAAAAVDATRLLLFAEGPVPSAASGTAKKLRRYRLARLQLDAASRAEGEPRYAYLKHSYD